jgi:hypothetical protein
MTKTIAPDEVTQLRDACALLGSHAAVVVQHRNMAATLLALAGRLRALGFGAPVAAAPPPTPARPPARDQGPGPGGLSVAQMLAEIQPDVVYARRREEVLARVRGTRGPGAGAAPPAAESLNPEDVYAARRAAAAGRR